jgi:hypothetical protein
MQTAVVAALTLSQGDETLVLKTTVVKNLCSAGINFLMSTMLSRAIRSVKTELMTDVSEAISTPISRVDGPTDQPLMEVQTDPDRRILILFSHGSSSEKASL